MEKINENIENKYKEFLELLKTNPEAIESQVVKNEYKELLESAFEEADTEAADLVSELLKLKILDESDNERYKELIVSAFENAKSNSYWAKIVPELLRLKILDKIDKKRYKELLKTAFKNAKLNYNLLRKGRWNSVDFNWAEYVVPELLKLKMLDESDKKWYKKLLGTAFENAKIDYGWRKVVLELLRLKIFDKSEIKEQYEELLEIVFKEAKEDAYWRAGEDSYWVECSAELLKLKVLDESDKELYKELLETAFKVAKRENQWAEYVVPELLKLKILDESEIKESYKRLLEKAFEKARFYVSWASGAVPALLKLKILDKSEIKESYRELLGVAFEQGKADKFWAGNAVPNLLELKILNESEIKESYKELLGVAFEQARFHASWASEVVPALLKLKILNESEIKESYRELLGVAFEQGKADKFWAGNAVPNLLELKILNESEIKESYKELLGVAFEQGKADKFWAGNAVPALLKLKILNESEINFDISLPQNITLNWMSFLERNKDRINWEDIELIDEIDNSFSKEEINYLYKQNYEFFKKIDDIIKENNYQKIWEVKKEIYPHGEKDKLHKMEEYFWEWMWTYFVDKVQWDKLLKNRFRNPHNALLHADKIIDLAKQLETKWINKEEFIKNYLWVAWDRNNWYQQLNDFLEKYKSDWKNLVEEAMNIDEFKENREFMSLAEWILEQERTGGLYKNLDNFEQVLTLLHMIWNKEALIKLQRLSNSNNPKDKKLYEYYKCAIYHPRTKPIIMKMYENPWEFLGLDDTTFSDLEIIHQAKKPSNMVENFEFLDFDAKDLVNCLPLWVYDKLSYFKPFEMKFFINGSDVYTNEEIQQKIWEFLLWADQKKISVIITKLKEQGDETMWFKQWKANKDGFIKNLLWKYWVENLINIFVNLWYSEFNKFRDLREMTAKISPKSDPNNWFNGFNCDSLAEWHGKKVVAMFNPYCTDFCIYEWEQDPKEDNLKVTSWVTLNRAIPENFSTLLWKVKSETTHDIANVLWDKFEDYKEPSEYVITMDNIEANPNFGRKNELAVRKMYEKFFSEYVRQNPMSPNWIPINTHKFYSWVNYNKLDILTDRVPNESLPVFVNAYSDNSASYSLQWNLYAWEQKEKKKKTWIHPLSIEDVVQISYMEWKIYPESMKDHLWNLQHEITASILNNTLKWRPNLSFAWYNEEWKIWWYILAYQWKMEDGTPWVYISDFAIDKNDRWTAWLKMIYHWMQEVKKNYPGMPVFTRARENTSYRMVKAFSDRYWYEITEDDLMRDGWENFHWVVMKPKK